MKSINRRDFLQTTALGSAAAFAGCKPGGGNSSGGRRFISIGTAPVGGVFFVVGGALSDTLNEYKGESGWKVTAESTGGSMENIRRISQGDIQFAISNSSITYFAVRGEEGWEQKHNVRALMTLFPLIAQFVTKKGSGINSLGDLKGKRVCVGPEGAGFEYFIRPILKAHGVSYSDFEPVYAGQQTSVGYLGDGSVAATFLGGGVPTGSITSAASTMDIDFISYDDKIKGELIEKYPFYGPMTVPGGTYKGVDEAFQGMNVGSAHLITGSDEDEELVYDTVKTIFENRKQIAAKAKPGKAINEKNVIRNTGTDFHPGAIRYYKEKGFWPGTAAG